MRGPFGGRSRRPGHGATLLTGASILSLLCALLATLAACAGPQPTPPTVPQVLRYPLIAPQHGTSAQTILRAYDPILALGTPYTQPAPGGIETGANAQVPVELVYPRLVEFDAKLAIRPGAASSWSVSPDGKTYTFTLRQGIHWSDGTPIDAGDFAFSLNRAASPCQGNPEIGNFAPLVDATAIINESCDSQGHVAGPIQTLIGDSILVVGPQTLVLKLAQPASWFLAALAMPLASAVPEQLVTRYPTTWTAHLTDNGGIGGNLFKPTASPLILKRYADYWGTQPILQQINLTLFTDPKIAYQNFLAGKLDIGYPPAGTSMGGAQQTPLPLMTSDLVNWTTAPFDDPTMRQAFALALDKQQLVQTVWGGAAIATNHIVPAGIPGYNTGLTGPLGTSITGNLATARALEQAYVQGHCGGKASACPPVTIWYTDHAINSPLATAAQAQARQWQAAFPGYPVTAKLYAREDNGGGALDTRAIFGRFQMLVVNWSVDYPDPQDWLQAFLPGQDPLSSIPDQAALTLIAKGMAAQSQALAFQNDQGAEQLLVDDVAEIPLSQTLGTWQPGPHAANYSEDALGLPSVVDQWTVVRVR